MNTKAASLSCSLSSDHSWLSPCSRRSSSRDASRRSLGSLLTYYVLASESPHNTDNDSDSVASIQAKETDYVRDTSDTESEDASGADVEYEPASELDEPPPPVHASDDDSDSQIIATQVISVGAVDEGEMQFADSEQSDAPSDPELGPNDYWQCAQCRNNNNNPLYRYCEKCFKERKDFFPPRPKRKCYTKSNKFVKNEPISELKSALISNSIESLRRSSLKYGSCSASSGVDSAYNSQELTTIEEPPVNQETAGTPSVSTSHSTSTLASESVDFVDGTESMDRQTKENTTRLEFVKSCSMEINHVILDRKHRLKRRAKSIERVIKRRREALAGSSSSDSGNSEAEGPECVTPSKAIESNGAGVATVQPVKKTLSDPFLTIESLSTGTERAAYEQRSVSEGESRGGAGAIPTKAIMASLKRKLESSEDNLCIVCCSAPKSGVFVHGRIAHICCCYRCAVKVWAKAKRCPVCNCKVSNVLKAVVM